MKTMTEYDLVMEAGEELRKRRLAVSPANVERVVNHARQVTVAEAVAGVNALVEKSKRAPEQRTTPKQEAQYAVPSRYWVRSSGASPERTTGIEEGSQDAPSHRR